MNKNEKKLKKTDEELLNKLDEGDTFANFDTIMIEQNEDGIFVKQKEEKEINLGESISEDVQEELDKEKKKNENQVVTKKSDNYKYFIYLFIILGITALVLWFNLTGVAGQTSTGKPIYVYQTIGEVFSAMNIGYFIMFMGFILLSTLINSLIIYFFARLYTRRYKYHQAVANTMIGKFYSAITPGASGGQFAQIVTFKKQGVPVSNSASIFVMSFIIYQTTLIIVGLVSIICRFDTLIAINSIPITLGDISFQVPVWIFIIAGFSLNLVVILLLLIMSYSKKFLYFVSHGLVNFLAKIRLVKNPVEKSKEIRIQVENYRIELRRLQSNIPFTCLIFLLTFLAMVITELSPFFSGLALNAFNLENMNVPLKMFDCVVFLNFHQMITGLIPLPGSAGISEMVFGTLFGKSSQFFSEEFYSKGGLNIILLVWRFGTFYIPFIINGIVSATYKSRGVAVKDRIIPVGDKKTMLTIQLETYTERKVSSDTIYETRALERKEVIEKLRSRKKKNQKIEVENDSSKEKMITREIHIGEE